MVEMNTLSKRAFTLVELLIVIVITIILIVIVVMNLSEAQIRSNVSRVKADIRKITSAMQSYYIDHRTYMMKKYTDESDSKIFLCIQQDLTTPIAYISQIPNDIFKYGIDGTFVPYPIYGCQYGGRKCCGNFGDILPTFGWVIWSVGPDYIDGIGDLSTPELELYPNRIFKNECRGNDEKNLGIRYDPTNGLTSYGDIIYWSGDWSRWDHHNMAGYWK